MSMPYTDGGNYDLKEEVRAYWSERSRTYDLSAGHRIAPGAEAAAWAREIRERLGDRPLRVLELACGTGEVTGVLHALGHDVTALDFSEDMLSRAKAKHAGKARLRFTLAAAEATMEPDGAFDAVVCRHLVWTLTNPMAAFAEWRRVLKPGGILLVFDGNWAHPTGKGRFAREAVAFLDRWLGDDGTHHAGMPEHHDAIMSRLPFGDGLKPEGLSASLVRAGFGGCESFSLSRVAAAQRSGAPVRDRLRTFVYARFGLVAHAVPERQQGDDVRLQTAGGDG